MTSKHTEGPWKLNRDQSIDAGNTHICYVDTADHNAGLGEGEGEANAILIAAAPVLLAALEEMVYAFANSDLAHHPSLADAKAAIAKATNQE